MNDRGPRADTVSATLALVLAGILSLAIAIGIGRFVYTPILPYMVAGLDLTKAEAGLIASANFLGYLVGAYAAALPVLSGDLRHWLLGVLIASAVTTGAMGWTDGLSMFVVLRFVGGAAGAAAMVFASTIVLDRLAQSGRPGWATAIYAGVGAGIALSSVAVPVAASQLNDWQQPWLVCGAISLVLVANVAFLLRGYASPETGSKTAAASGAPVRLGWFVVAYGLFGFGYVITATFISDMVRGDPDLQPVEHLVWLCVGLSALPSVAFWGWIGRHRGYGNAFAIACLVEAAGVLINVLGSGVAAILVSGALVGGTFMGLTALGLIQARIIAPGNPRRAVALMTGAFGVGQMLGPTLAGLMHDAQGSYLVPSMIAATGLVIAAGLSMQRTGANRSN